VIIRASIRKSLINDQSSPSEPAAQGEPSRAACSILASVNPIAVDQPALKQGAGKSSKAIFMVESPRRLWFVVRCEDAPVATDDSR